MKKDSRDILVLPCKPQQILASVSEGVQRLQQHLQSHPLGLPLPREPLHAKHSAFQKQPVSERTREATSKKAPLLVEDEGVIVAVQVCGNLVAPLSDRLCPLVICSKLWEVQHRCCGSQTTQEHPERADFSVVAMQARNNIHRAAILLGAAVVGKVGKIGNRLKEHHAKMKEEGVYTLPLLFHNIITIRALALLAVPTHG